MSSWQKVVTQAHLVTRAGPLAVSPLLAAVALRSSGEGTLIEHELQSGHVCQISAWLPREFPRSSKSLTVSTLVQSETSNWSAAQMTTERCQRAACHLCAWTCEWQQGRKTSASNQCLMPGSCTDSVCVGDLSGSQDLSVSPKVRKVCSHFVQEEALRDARAGCVCVWGGRILHTAFI